MYSPDLLQRRRLYDVLAPIDCFDVRRERSGKSPCCHNTTMPEDIVKGSLGGPVSPIPLLSSGAGLPFCTLLSFRIGVRFQ